MSTSSSTITEQHISRASHMHDYTSTTDEEKESEAEVHLDEEEQEEELQGENDEKISTLWQRWYMGTSSNRVVDPKTKWVQEWNRVFLLVCAAGLFVDPLFFYSLSVSYSSMCLFVDGWFAVTVTVLRCMTDALHLWNIFLRFKMAKWPFAFTTDNAVVDNHGCSIALDYLKSRRGFLFDLFVILPIPQVRISSTNFLSFLLLLLLFKSSSPAY